MADLTPNSSHRLIIRRLGIQDNGPEAYWQFVTTCVFTYDGVTLMKSGWGHSRDMARYALAERMGDFLQISLKNMLSLLSPIPVSTSKARYALTDTGDADDTPQ